MSHYLKTLLNLQTTTVQQFHYTAVFSHDNVEDTRQCLQRGKTLRQMPRLKFIHIGGMAVRNKRKQLQLIMLPATY